MAISLARSIAEEGLVGMEVNMELINKFSSSMRAGGPSGGFSIRGMVQEMRKRDIRKTWPFSSVLLDQYLGQGSRSSLQVGSAAQGSPGSRNDTDAKKRDLQGAKTGEECAKEDQIELQLEFEELRVDESEKWERQTEMIERSIGQLGLTESEKSEEKERILYCDARIEAETLQRRKESDNLESDKGDDEEEENDEGKFEHGLTASGSSSGFGLGLELSEQINGSSGALCCPVCHGTWHSLSALNAHLDRCLSPKKIKGKGQKTRSITDIIATQKFALQQQKDKRSGAAAAARFKRCSKSKKSGGIKRKQKSCSGNLNEKGEDEDDEDECAGPDKTSEISKQIHDPSHCPSKGGTGQQTASDPSADSQDEREAVHQPCTLNAQDIEENFASGAQNGGIRRDSDDTTLRIGLVLENSSEPVDPELPVQAPDFLAEACEPSNPSASAEAVDLSVNPVQPERSGIAAPSSSPADPNKRFQQPRPTIPVYESVISSLRSSTAISIGTRQFVPTWKAAVVMATLGAPILRQGPSAPSSCATAPTSFVHKHTPVPEPLPNSRVDHNVEQLQQRPHAHASTMAPVSHSNHAVQPNITHVLVINSIVPPAQINPEQFAPPQPADHCHLQNQWHSQPAGLRSSLFDRNSPNPHMLTMRPDSHNVPAWLQPVHAQSESPLQSARCLVSGSAEKPVFRLLGQNVSLPGSAESEAPHRAGLEKGLHFQTPDQGHDGNAGLLRISQDNLSNRARISDTGSIRLISRQEFDQTFPAFYYQNRNGGSYQANNSNVSYVGNSTNLLNLQQYSNSPRNVQRDTSGLPPWLAAAKKQQKDAEMEANVIVIDDDEPDDVSQSCASEVTRQIDARFNSESFRSQNMQGLMSGSKRHAESVTSVNNLEPAQKQARFNQLECSFGPLPRQASNLGVANALAAKRGAAAQEYKARIAMMKADGLELLYEGHASYPGTGVHGSTRQWGSHLIDETSNPRLFVSPLQSGLREGLVSSTYSPNFGIHSVGNSSVAGADLFQGGAQNPHWTITSDQNQFMRESHSSSLKKVKQPNRQLPPVFGWVPQPQVISRAVNGYNTGGGLISTANGHYVVMSGTMDSSSSTVFPGQQNSRIYPAHFSTQGMSSAGWSMSANVPITSYGKRAPWTAASQE